jgi:hypothetical protein
MTATSPVLKQIAGLPKLSQDELQALWREYFGVEPPAYRRGFLVRGLAHRIQELTYGGLKPAYQARLDAMIEGMEKPNGAGRPGRRARQDVNLLEGTKLLREWRGVTHEVTVIDGGYEHQGKRYRSLSAVARAITGTQWSGPLFFGLRKTREGPRRPAPSARARRSTRVRCTRSCATAPTSARQSTRARAIRASMSRSSIAPPGIVFMRSWPRTQGAGATRRERGRRRRSGA